MFQSVYQLVHESDHRDLSDAQGVMAHRADAIWLP